MEYKCEVLIIGAGPAGLAAGNYCIMNGIDTIIVESGSKLNERTRTEEDLLVGVGGCGLYSDGKISHYPSATNLWKMPCRSAVENGYSWIMKLASDMTIQREIIFDSGEVDTEENSHEIFKQKHYHCDALSNEQRDELLERITKPVAHRIHTYTKITNVVKHETGYRCLATRIGAADTIRYDSDYVVFAGGRYSPMHSNKFAAHSGKRFQKFEIGVRIQQESKHFFLNKCTGEDVKLIANSSDKKVQWRTFCCCKDGEIVGTKSGVMTTYSGSRAETGLSNAGFLLRVLCKELYTNDIKTVEKYVSGLVLPFNTTIEEYINACEASSSAIENLLGRGLELLSQQFELSEATVHGPCVESIGEYPATTEDLESVTDKHIYVAGDATGKFRGLLAAIVSGYYVADQIRCSRVATVTGIPKLAKQSHLGRMPIVFTAQSKKYFYCRDAVCEFVLKQNVLPINPFRVFDYFLGDRVDRDVIRRGNNNLIRLCEELWVFGPIADGVLFEILYAIEIHMPVRFFSIGTRATDINEVRNTHNIKFEREINWQGIDKESLLKGIRAATKNLSGPDTQHSLPLL